jgi:hypothetical protein
MSYTDRSNDLVCKGFAVREHMIASEYASILSAVQQYNSSIVVLSYLGTAIPVLSKR